MSQLSDSSLGALQWLFDLEDGGTSAAGNPIFVGSAPGLGEEALYGGHLIGQATAAAHQTAKEGSLMHSLHSYFLLPGDGLTPVNYEVAEIRQGRSFGARRVFGTQGGRQIFDLTASFHSPEQDDKTPMAIPVPAALDEDPTAMPTFQECIDKLGPIFGEHWSYYPRPVEYRVARAPWLDVGASERRGIDFWFRVERQLPDTPGMHTALLAYMSDDCLSDNVGVPYGVTAGTENAMMLSLDHTMWFHRPVLVDEWVYVEQWPLAAAGARGTAQAHFWQDGQLVATAVQEALARF